MENNSIVINFDHFKRQFSQHKKIVYKKSTLSVLSSIVITEDNKMVSTDLEVGLTTQLLPTSVYGKDNYVMPLTEIEEVIKTFSTKDKNVDIIFEKVNEYNNYSINVSMSNNPDSKLNIASLDNDDYPVIPSILKETKEVQKFEFYSEKLLTVLERIQHSQSKDESRYFLKGIYFESEKNVNKEKVQTVNLVCTDGKRLSKSELTDYSSNSVENNIGVIIPSKAIKTVISVLKQLKKEDKKAFSYDITKVYFSENKVYFVPNNRFEIVSNLLEGQFPNYRQVTPNKDNNTLSFYVSTKDFTEKLKSLKNLVSKEYKTKDRIFFQPRKDNLKSFLDILIVDTISDDMLIESVKYKEVYNNYNLVVESKDKQTNNLLFSININYLYDTLKSIDYKIVPSLEISLKSHKDPIIIDPSYKDYGFDLIMPMILKSELKDEIDNVLKSEKDKQLV